MSEIDRLPVQGQIADSSGQHYHDGWQNMWAISSHDYAMTEETLPALRTLCEGSPSLTVDSHHKVQVMRSCDAYFM